MTSSYTRHGPSHRTPPLLSTLIRDSRSPVAGRRPCVRDTPLRLRAQLHSWSPPQTPHDPLTHDSRPCLIHAHASCHCPCSNAWLKHSRSALQTSPTPCQRCKLGARCTRTFLPASLSHAAASPAAQVLAAATKASSPFLSRKRAIRRAAAGTSAARSIFGAVTATPIAADLVQSASTS